MSCPSACLVLNEDGTKVEDDDVLEVLGNKTLLLRNYKVSAQQAMGGQVANNLRYP